MATWTLSRISADRDGDLLTNAGDRMGGTLAKKTTPLPFSAARATENREADCDQKADLSLPLSASIDWLPPRSLALYIA